MKLTLPLASLLLSLSLAACGGSGTSPTPSVIAAAPTPAPGASAAPLPTPTPQAAQSPTQSPQGPATAAPTATPVPASLKRLGGAPLSATASQLSTTRRVAQAQGFAASGLPILVESSGMAAQWGGAQTLWVTNLANAADIPETSLTVTPSNALAIVNPAPSALSCLGSVSAVCIKHPTAWQFGTSSANGKPVGKATLTMAFGDGTTGTTADYVYDGWALLCNTGFVYQAGGLVATSTRNASDVYVDCITGNIVFPQGGILALNPTPDQFGRYETIMPTITSAILMSSFISNVPFAAITNGEVFGIATKDGGVAKVYFNGTAQSPPSPVVEGLSLYANPDGTYAF